MLVNQKMREIRKGREVRVRFVFEVNDCLLAFLREEGGPLCEAEWWKEPATMKIRTRFCS